MTRAQITDAVCHDHILAHLRAVGLGALADLGFRSLDNDVRDPVIFTHFHASRTHKLTAGQKNAHRVLAKLRTDPARATQLLRALPVLTNLEVNR